MNKKAPLFFFFLILFVHVIGGLLTGKWLEYVSKPLIVLSLAVYFFQQTRQQPHPLKKWIYLALLFSWCGDILLMFQENGADFFIVGLSSFLVAHIFYILFFHRVRLIEKLRSNVLLLVLVVIYYAVLTGFLSPYLGELKIPVRVYGLVISFMFMLALHMIFLPNRPAGWLLVTGAGLFVISDSVLAINKFYASFQFAGTIIMITYGLAQYFIVEGVIKYLRSQE